MAKKYRRPQNTHGNLLDRWLHVKWASEDLLLGSYCEEVYGGHLKLSRSCGGRGPITHMAMFELRPFSRCSCLTSQIQVFCTLRVFHGCCTTNKFEIPSGSNCSSRFITFNRFVKSLRRPYDSYNVLGTNIWHHAMVPAQ